MFGRRIKKIKTSDDFVLTMGELFKNLREFVDSGNADRYQVAMYAEMAFRANEITEAEFEEILLTVHDKDTVADFLYRHGVVSHFDYERRKVDAACEAAIQRIKTENIDPFLSGMETVEENILRNANKKINELNLRFGHVDFIDYEIEKANINEEPYVKVFFSPSEEGSDQLEIDIRYNEYFIERLKEREGFRHSHDEEGNLIVEDLVEQWFHTAIIVLAANMLKESDLDFFRSVSSDDPGAELIQRLEFDREAIPEEYREQMEEFMKHKGIYR